MEIGQKIKAVRLKLRMSQTEFAQLFGVCFAMVNRWEKGRAALFTMMSPSLAGG